MTELQKTLTALSDPAYAAFQAKLVPTAGKERILGVRVPVLRRFAKEYAKKPESREFLHTLPYVEAENCENPDAAVTAVLSGQTALFAPEFGARCVLLDLRTYPARTTQEPESDRVMQGARDGFVETLVMNTALVRRRVRDPRLTMEYFNLGGSSATDVVMCYMHGVADEKKLAILRKKLKNAHPKSLTLGFQGLAETLIRTRWYNPFPKIRTTERPDTAAAQVLEGNILIFVDTSPQVMLLPTSIFDYLQQTDDYYFPPLTGSYLRVVRTAILLLSVISSMPTGCRTRCAF